MMSTIVLETCRGMYYTYYKTRICALSLSVAKICMLVFGLLDKMPKNNAVYVPYIKSDIN